MQSIKSSILESYEKILNSAPEIIGAVLIFVIIYSVGRYASAAAAKFFKRDGVFTKKEQLIKKSIRWFFSLFGLFVALNMVGLTKVATSFLAAGGVMAIVVGFAFRDIGENLIAGLFLSVSRSFEVGDLIESNGLRGVVRSINIRELHIRTGDGTDIFIPSAIIYKNPLRNFTRDGLRQSNFTIGIDYGDDLEKAKNLLGETLLSLKSVLKTPKSDVQISGFTPNYVELTVLFWINTRNKEESLSKIKTEVMITCHKALKEGDFTFSSNVKTGLEIDPLSVKLDKLS